MRFEDISMENFERHRLLETSNISKKSRIVKREVHHNDESQTAVFLKRESSQRVAPVMNKRSPGVRHLAKHVILLKYSRLVSLISFLNGNRNVETVSYGMIFR